MVVKSVLAALALAASTSVAGAATLFDENFDSYIQGAPSSIGPTWTVDVGSVDVIGTPGSFQWYPTQQIDLNGSGGDSTAAYISTVVTGFIVGKTYTLSFDYGANKNSSPFGSSTVETLLYGVGPLSGSITINGFVANLISASYTFTATAISQTLFFADGNYGSPFDDDNDQGGPILDNVKISYVPVPAAASLLLLGLGGLAAMRRRRKSA